MPQALREPVFEGFSRDHMTPPKLADNRDHAFEGVRAREASRIDYAPFCRVTDDDHIWWRLEDAYKLAAGYQPICDDEQNLESVLVAPSPRVRANERELLASFHRGHPDIATARVLERDDGHFVDALEFLAWLSQYLARTQLGIAYPTELVRAVRDAVKAQRRQPLIDGQFESLVGALCEWLAKPLADLPEEQRGRVARDFPMPWDELSPDQRRSAAAQWDYQHDPATEQERNRAWDLVCRLDDVKREIREWELLKPNSITEKAEQANRLRDLHEKARQLDAEIMDSEPQQDGHAPPAPPATEAATFISLHTVEQNTIQLKAIEQNTFNVTQFVIVQTDPATSPHSDLEPSASTAPEQTPSCQEHPAPPVSSARPATECTVTTHKLKTRSNILAAVIDKAKKNAVNPSDHHSVWSALVVLAEAKDPPPPLIGFSSDGVQYRGKRHEATGEPDVFTRKNLGNRMGRKRRAQAR